MEFKVKKGKWRLVTNDENDLFGGLDNYNKIVSGCEFYDKITQIQVLVLVVISQKKTPY